MSLLNKILGRTEKKSYSPSIPPTTKEERIFWDGMAGGHLGAMRVSAAMRAGSVVASGMGMMPIEVAGSDEITALLNDRPNPLMTGVELVEMLSLHAVFAGVGRAFIDRNVISGKINGIYPMLPNWGVGGWDWSEADNAFTLEVTIPDMGSGGGYVGRFKRDDIFEVTAPRWEMTRALNVTRICCDVLGLSEQMQGRNKRLTDTSTPLGIITAKEGVSEGAMQALKSSWAKQFGSSGIAMIDFDASFSQLMQTAADTQLTELMQFQIEEVARMYGVHPYMLMKTSGSGAQGAISDVLLFHQVHTMGPWIRRWESALKRSVTKGRAANFDESALLRTTPSARAEIHARALGSGGNKPWMTQNEVRASWGLEGHEDGNSLSLSDETGETE